MSGGADTKIMLMSRFQLGAEVHSSGNSHVRTQGELAGAFVEDGAIQGILLDHNTTYAVHYSSLRTTALMPISILRRRFVL
jgi:hypothetical protein